MASAKDEERYLADVAPRVAGLEVSESFKALSQSEKLYAYWLSRASWAGGRIIMKQWTHSAELLYDFLIALFTDPATPQKLAGLDTFKNSVSGTDWQHLLSYAAQCMSNLVNYRTFGDIKFIPRLDVAAFETVVQASGNPQAKELWPRVKHYIYSSDPSELQIGQPSEGHISSYYSWESSTTPPTPSQIEATQNLCNQHRIITTNTNLHKFSDVSFELRIASVQTTGPLNGKTLKSNDGIQLTFAYGLYSKELNNVSDALRQAAKYCGSNKRAEMLQHYVASFDTGDIEEHKKGSQVWVTDVGPTVESYIGFIEAYVDPTNARAEWEGFCSIVNRDLSRKFTNLVDQAPHLIKCLPWGPDWEVETFQRPDYTALEIVNFATGGIPAGINLPNHDEVRETHGFKNVSLINIMGSSPDKADIKFLEPEDLDMFVEWQQRTFEVQVANHELLGHGSGKLLMERADGTLNFDKDLINPFTGKPVETWYKPGERPGTRLGDINGSMEECRAEAAAVFLCSNLDILKVFGYTDEKDIKTLRIMTYLSMSWAGLRALEYYDPKTRKHGQAHMRARFGIFKWLHQAGIAKLNVEYLSDGTVSNATVSMIESAVLDGTAQASIGDLLKKLQVLKATADGTRAKAFYEDFTAVEKDEWSGPLRDFILANKSPRKLFVQPNLIKKQDDAVEIVDYDKTFEGMLQSMVERRL